MGHRYDKSSVSDHGLSSRSGRMKELGLSGLQDLVEQNFFKLAAWPDCPAGEAAAAP